MWLCFDTVGSVQPLCVLVVVKNIGAPCDPRAVCSFSALRTAGCLLLTANGLLAVTWKKQFVPKLPSTV